MPGPALPQRRTLLVEGPDDKHVVMHLCQGTVLECRFYIDAKGGKDPLLDAIRNEVRVSGREALGYPVGRRQRRTESLERGNPRAIPSGH